MRADHVRRTEREDSLSCQQPRQKGDALPSARDSPNGNNLHLLVILLFPIWVMLKVRRKANRLVHKQRCAIKHSPLLSVDQGPTVTSESINRGDVIALCELLEIIGIPALLLERRGLVIAANELARSSLGIELRIVNERLASPHLAANAAVSRLISCVTTADPRFSPRAVSIRRNNDLPIVVYGFRLTNSALESFDPVHAMLVLVEPRSKLLPSESQLKDAFELSWMEAKLALRLARGDTLNAAATICGVTYETARTLVKSAYQKTGTHRQAELVALIYSIALIPRPIASFADSAPSCELGSQSRSPQPVKGGF